MPERNVTPSQIPPPPHLGPFELDQVHAGDCLEPINDNENNNDSNREDTMNYAKFLNAKTQKGAMFGFNPVFYPSKMFDFQKYLLEWSLKKGRSANFADCGLGKTLIELAWAENIIRVKGGNVLLLTPLAVGPQTIREGEKFGIDARHSRDGKINHRITVTNYEQLHFFDPKDFVAVICDESSILKSFDGVYRGLITEFMRKVPYRLLCTATAAPNNYIELGTSSEALGFMGYVDMLNRFFVNSRNNSATRRMYGEAPKWRFKGHAELVFWRWVCSWAKAVRKPSDLGFGDNEFNLPPLIEKTHVVKPRTAPEGYLFVPVYTTLKEQRYEAKRSIQERCEKAAEIAGSKDQVIVWCNRNNEGDLLKKLIPDSVQVSGPDPDIAKEEKFLAFAENKVRVLITKPKIGAWGLNFQNCHRIILFPSHSYEQYYQSIRRCWRFGQKKTVLVDIIITDGEKRVLENLQRKAKAADAMFDNLIGEMNRPESINVDKNYNEKEEFPSWL